MTDPTEGIRRMQSGLINAVLSEDETTRFDELVMEYGLDNVWTSDSVSETFIIEGFMSPYVVVRRRSDNVMGVLTFCHSPRFYFDFRPD